MAKKTTKTEKIDVRVTKEEAELIKKAADAAGLSRSEYVRRSVVYGGSQKVLPVLTASVMVTEIERYIEETYDMDETLTKKVNKLWQIMNVS